MDVIYEVNPFPTDTQQEMDDLVKVLQDQAREQAEADDFFAECPDDSDENELLEESSTIMSIDGKKKEFTYLSSFSKNGDMISFGQDNLGLWWYFDRVNITTGKNLKGPFRTKEKLLTAMESVNA